MARGFVIGAPRSGSGKTLVTLGILAALKARGMKIAPAKAGPDYIDTAILSRVAGRQAVNLDPWAMSPGRLRGLADAAARDADVLVVEGVMGLFDGAADGRGSTGDLAATLGLPVVLVVDAAHMGQSVAPLVAGFARWRENVHVAGVILNRVSTTRHERLLSGALGEAGFTVLGALPTRDGLALPARYLGLVLPDSFAGFHAVVAAAREAVEAYVDLETLLHLGDVGPGEATSSSPRLPPLGQHVAIARDEAFAFIYAHWLEHWRQAGATLSFFSPLADESPAADADAVFLPGGYPELYGARLAAAGRFKDGLVDAAKRGALLYGECGGFMALGRSLTDGDGVTHAMADLLPAETSIGNPKRVLGYRRLSHASPLPWPGRLSGHEFHYSSGRTDKLPPLFEATDARGEALPPMGVQLGNVMGSYAHVIDVA